MYFLALVAFGAAAYFVAAAGRQPRPAVIVAAVLWLLYGVYEILIGNGVLCDAKCNIRVDLLLIWPVLLVTSLLAGNSLQPWRTALKVLGVIVLLLAVQAALTFGYIALFEPPGTAQSDQGSQTSPK